MQIWHRDGCYKSDWFGSGFIYARQTKPNYICGLVKRKTQAMLSLFLLIVLLICRQLLG